MAKTEQPAQVSRSADHAAAERIRQCDDRDETVSILLDLLEAAGYRMTVAAFAKRWYAE